MYLYDSKLPVNKNFVISLQAVFGLGKNNSIKLCKKLGFCFNLKTLSKPQIFRLNKTLTKLNFIFANELKKFQIKIFKQKLDIKLLKSFRKLKGLPIRGQRTHTNAKTAKKQKNN